MSATKDQERKALDQIRKIVAGLGEDSYIGMAFEGCFEIAEENINNDFACSMKQRAESAEAKADKLKKDNKYLTQTVKNLENQTNDALKRADEQASKNNQNCKANVELWNKFREAEERADAAKQEIIRLKAKLYDFMCEKQ